jgi:hypothetical protein
VANANDFLGKSDVINDKSGSYGCSLSGTLAAQPLLGNPFVVWTAAYFDPHSWWDGHTKITVPYAGLYEVSAMVSLGNVTVGQHVQMGLYQTPFVNTVEILSMPSEASRPLDIFLSYTFKANIGDFFRVILAPTDGSGTYGSAIDFFSVMYRGTLL